MKPGDGIELLLDPGCWTALAGMFEVGSHYNPAAKPRSLRFVRQRQEPVSVQALVAQAPLNDPTKAWSVGLPRRLKSRATPLSRARGLALSRETQGQLSARIGLGARRVKAILVIA